MASQSEEAVSFELAIEAQEDLKEIQRYIIVEKNNEHGAEVVSNYLLEAFEKIGDDPARCGGRERPDITSRSY